jgi:DNA gyrase subunit A
METEPQLTLVSIEDQMKDAYLEYAMSVIVGRALPDARDGMKPVHRRILYAMYDMGNTYDKAYKKSARIVGDVIGKYHPHGDLAVYETMVRMAQDFSMRYPLVDGQGNFGSVDGDSAAAMRYTEVRLAKIANEVLSDLEKETVDFGANYDNSLKEPLVLPTRVPNLLVNGSSGIAVGMATNIPPHNLGEIIDGVKLLIDKPEAGVAEFMKLIPGPDFPTAGFIYGRKGQGEADRERRGSGSGEEDRGYFRSARRVRSHRDADRVRPEEGRGQPGRAQSALQEHPDAGFLRHQHVGARPPAAEGDDSEGNPRRLPQSP